MAMITFTDDISSVNCDSLRGLFAGWARSVSTREHMQILHNSQHCVLAVDAESGSVVGFITAISDGVLAAYIPLLEVRVDYQGRGIGSELVRRMLRRLGGLYMVDVVCDADLEPFYRRFGFSRGHAMMMRNLQEKRNGNRR
jgi:ribosomal protein S18 acetylase RimI-like enzyme